MSAGWCIAETLAIGQERHNLIPIGRAHVGINANALDSGRCCCLKESTAGASLDGSDCLSHGSDVSLEVARVLGKNCRFLSTESSGFGKCLLGLYPVSLVSFDVGFELQLGCLSLLQGSLDLWDLGVRSVDGSCEIIGTSGAVAHELVEKFLFLFAFGSDLVLHLLEHGHDFPDGIRRMLSHCVLAGSSQW